MQSIKFREFIEEAVSSSKYSSADYGLALVEAKPVILDIKRS